MPFSSMWRPDLRLWALTAAAVVVSPTVADVAQRVPALMLTALALLLTAILVDAGPRQRHGRHVAATVTARRRRAPWVQR